MLPYHVKLDGQITQPIRHEYFKADKFKLRQTHDIATSTRSYTVDVRYSKGKAIGFYGKVWGKLCTEVQVKEGWYLLLDRCSEHESVVQFFDETGKEVSFIEYGQERSSTKALWITGESSLKKKKNFHMSAELNPDTYFTIKLTENKMTDTELIIPPEFVRSYDLQNYDNADLNGPISTTETELKSYVDATKYNTTPSSHVVLTGQWCRFIQEQNFKQDMNLIFTLDVGLFNKYDYVRFIVTQI